MQAQSGSHKEELGDPLSPAHSRQGQGSRVGEGVHEGGAHGRAHLPVVTVLYFPCLMVLG